MMGKLNTLLSFSGGFAKPLRWMLQCTRSASADAAGRSVQTSTASSCSFSSWYLMKRLPLVSSVSWPLAPVLSCSSFGMVSNGLNRRPDAEARAFLLQAGLSCECGCQQDATTNELHRECQPSARHTSKCRA